MEVRVTVWGRTWCLLCFWPSLCLNRDNAHRGRRLGGRERSWMNGLIVGSLCVCVCVFLKRGGVFVSLKSKCEQSVTFERSVLHKNVSSLINVTWRSCNSVIIMTSNLFVTKFSVSAAHKFNSLNQGFFGKHELALKVRTTQTRNPHRRSMEHGVTEQTNKGAFCTQVTTVQTETGVQCNVLIKVDVAQSCQMMCGLSFKETQTTASPAADRLILLKGKCLKRASSCHGTSLLWKHCTSLTTCMRKIEHNSSKLFFGDTCIIKIIC